MDEIFDKLAEIKVVPVVVINDGNDALDLGKALINSGLPCAEITFRTPVAAEVIRRLAQAYPEMLIGAGTVLTKEQALSAVESGAKFIVSPGFNPLTGSACEILGVPYIPGTATATELESALSHGYEYVKFFPAEQCGGAEYIKALSAPFRDVKFMPTGGITLNNLNKYLSLPSVFACGCSFMVSRELLKDKNWSEVTRLCRSAVDSIKTAN